MTERDKRNEMLWNDLGEKLSAAGCKKWDRATITIALVVPLTLVMISSLALFERKETTKRIQTCLERNGERKSVHGVVRQAGSAFFVYSDRWNAIAPICHGKGAAHCEAANPGIVVLGNNIGQPVTVEFCENDVIAYSVAGQRYVKR